MINAKFYILENFHLYVFDTMVRNINYTFTIEYFVAGTKFIKKHTYPFGHFVSVSVSVMIVQNKDGTDNTAGHHKHYAVEVRPCENIIQI